MWGVARGWRDLAKRKKDSRTQTTMWGLWSIGVIRCINDDGKNTIKKKAFCSQINLMYTVRDTSCILTY